MNRNGVSCVIPARLNSSRFPNKLVYPLKGIPAICRTVSIALSLDCFDEVICLTDSPEIKEVLSQIHCRVVMTGPAANGTDRIARNLESIKSELIVNLQGDEPVFPVKELERMCDELRKGPDRVHILVCKSDIPRILDNPNRVKVIADNQGRVSDFTRVISNRGDKEKVFGIQLGIYAYSKEFLHAYGSAVPSRREREVSHELLRNMSCFPVQAHYTEQQSSSLDVPEDIKEILEKIK